MHLIIVILQQDMTTIATGKVLYLGKLAVRNDRIPHIVILLILENLHSIEPLLNVIATNHNAGGIPIAL